MNPEIKTIVNQEIESYGIDRAKSLIASGRVAASEIAVIIRKNIHKTRMNDMMAISKEMPLMEFAKDCLKIESLIESEITS